LLKVPWDGSCFDLRSYKVRMHEIYRFNSSFARIYKGGRVSNYDSAYRIWDLNTDRLAMGDID
jgi:hypothetical protein